MPSRILGAVAALSLLASPVIAGTFHATVSGIPILAAISQGATCIGPDIAVTTKHGTVPYETLATSPRYDLRLVRLPGCETPRFATVKDGDTVTARGADAFGDAEAVQTTVLHARSWVCEPVYIPDIHTADGPCTRIGKGYSYGVMIDAGGQRSDMRPGGQEGTHEAPWTGHVRPGFSGGPLEDSTGAVAGIIAYGKVDSDGKPYAWAYPVATALAEFATQLASR